MTIRVTYPVPPQSAIARVVNTAVSSCTPLVIGNIFFWLPFCYHHCFGIKSAHPNPNVPVQVLTRYKLQQSSIKGFRNTCRCQWHHGRLIGHSQLLLGELSRGQAIFSFSMIYIGHSSNDEILDIRVVKHKDSASTSNR